MTYRVNLLAGGLSAALALGCASGAGAQERAAENLLTAEQGQGQGQEQEREPERERGQEANGQASFDEAFPRMISDPVVQGDLEPPGPLVQPWSIANAEKLARFIEGIAAEGLDPRDYDLQALRTALRSAPSVELDEIASRNFVWLVEDLRDGRTPMKARKQWFVVDPDRERYRTGDLLEKALETGDIAGTLESLNPSYPDYARLREALAATPEEDAANARALAESEKDRAENLMIVDLMRNDLSRVCAAGQVRAPRLFETQALANVHHLVSTVQGRLSPGRTAFDALYAAFPPGSVTGAPKSRALEIIAELEGEARGPYCGAFGYIDRSGEARFSVLIRTVAFYREGQSWRAQFRSGGAVTIDSDPAAEYAETLHKARAIIGAFGLAEAEIPS